jgi:hypothetical protein
MRSTTAPKAASTSATGDATRGSIELSLQLEVVSEVSVSILGGGPLRDDGAHVISELLRQPKAGDGVFAPHATRMVLALELLETCPVAIHAGPDCISIHEPSVPHGELPDDSQPTAPVRRDARHESLLDLAEACSVPTRWSCRTGVCHNRETP